MNPSCHSTQCPICCRLTVQCVLVAHCLMLRTRGKSAVALMFWPQSFFSLSLSLLFLPPSLWALRWGSLPLRLGHVSLLSESFALCGSSAHSQRCRGWNVRCNSEGLAHRGKVMARSPSQKKVPQHIVSAQKSLTADKHCFLRRATPERETSKLRVKLN